MTLSYISSVTNRSLNDIIVRNTRAFFNVADWVRIDNNTRYAREMVLDIKGGIIPRIELNTPTRETKPTAANINALVQNIIYVQEAADVPSADYYTLFANYEDGADKPAPDYIAVNSWEKVIEIIVTKYWLLSVVRYLVTGIGITGSDEIRQNWFRR